MGMRQNCILSAWNCSETKVEVQCHVMKATLAACEVGSTAGGNVSPPGKPTAPSSLHHSKLIKQNDRVD